MLAQQRAQLVLKRNPLVMVLLVPNVIDHVLNVRLADGKRSIAMLPMKTLEARSFRFDPFGRTGFQLFDDFGNSLGARQSKQRVKMVGHAIHG